MALIVQKFGGTSVANRDRLFNVARIVATTRAEGNDVVVVVSAQGDTTDDLIEKANEITHTPSKREMDMLLSTGEQITIALLAMALDTMGVAAISLTGWQAGFHTSTTHTKARIRDLDTERIENELSKNRVVIVAGFQGINRNHHARPRRFRHQRRRHCRRTARGSVPDLHGRRRRLHRRPAPCAARPQTGRHLLR